jgi:hypothetical protein
VHSLLKERLHGFTQEEIFGKKGRRKIRPIPPGTPLHFQADLLLGWLELLKDKILLLASPFTALIEILTSMKGVSVFIVTAVTAGVIDAGRFKNSKTFTASPPDAGFQHAHKKPGETCGSLVGAAP